MPSPEKESVTKRAHAENAPSRPQDASKELERSRLVHEWVADMAMRVPDRVAVEFEENRLTYAQLNARANHLANHLRSLGVGPDVLVGLWVERGLEMLVGLLGILKAGGAYVPLDPAFPRERIAFMLDDARAHVVLTQACLLEQWPEIGQAGPSRSDGSPDTGFANPKVVCLDRDWQANEKRSAAPVSSGVNGENLICVIYTSGSTGRPKGVQIVHRAMTNLLASIQREPGLTERDVWLAITTLSFDIAGLEMYLPLVSGAKVVILSREAARDGKRLAQELERTGATVLQGTPAMWRLLLEAGWKGDGRLKMLSGGESLPRELARRLLQRGGELWNLYGPTETTIYSTGCRVRAEDETILIGRPIAETQAYILDEQRKPVSDGVAGELYLGGTGLARGYLNRPDLTAEKFVPNPFVPEGTGQLYRTGDLARFLWDGSIEYLGRIDQQVKIRGFRIEMGEIEAVLEAHPRVRQCVATTCERQGDKRLVAYVATKGSERPAIKDLREHLARQLPDYMVPALYVFMESLPLTPSGKIDRKALPPPEGSLLESAGAYFAPTDEMELNLTRIWEEVLGREPIGIKDNFFDLGGDSLLTVKLVSRIEAGLGQSLSPPVLFRAPTVESLARVIREGGDRSAEHGVVALQPSGRATPLFCLNWTFLYQDLARHLGSGQPVYAVYSPIEDELRAAVADRSIRLTMEELAGRYVELIRTAQPHGPYRLAGISFGGVLAYEVAQQLCRAGEMVDRLALLDALLPRASKPAPLGQVRRAAHHLRQTLRRGPGYLFGKLKARREWEEQLRQQQHQPPQIAPARSAETTADQIEQLRIWWTDEMVASYQPVTYPGGALLLRAREQQLSLQQNIDQANGWSDLVSDGLSIEEVPGNHSNFYLEPHAIVLAQKLKSYLDKTPESAGDVAHAPSTTECADNDLRTEHATSASPSQTTTTKSLLFLAWFEKMRALVE